MTTFDKGNRIGENLMSYIQRMVVFDGPAVLWFIFAVNTLFPHYPF